MLIKQRDQGLWGDVESDSCWGVSALGSAVRHCPGIGTHTRTHTHLKLAPEHTLSEGAVSMSVTPPSHLYSHHCTVFFRLGQCHFPLCMWIIEIRLSTVIVHCVEPSVIVNQNVLRDFTNTGTKKRKKRRNKWTTDDRKRKKNTKTQHTTWASIYCTLYICHSICLNMEDLKVYVN